MDKNPIHTLDGKLLCLFLEVYECNSVSRAADRLGLTQSTVSHGVERLRRCLRDPLFVRDGRNIAPTAHAAHIAPMVRKALSAMEALSEPKEYKPAADTQMLTIAVRCDELQSELSAIYRELSQAAPKMPIRFLHLGAAVNARHMLESGEADLVIMVRSGLTLNELEHQPILTDTMVTFYDATVRPKINGIKEFANARHATLDFGGTRKSLLQTSIESLGLEREIDLMASDIHTLAQLMQGTPLVATMQKRFQHSAFALFSYCDPPISLPQVHYDMYWHRRQTQCIRHQWIRDHVQASFDSINTGTRPSTGVHASAAIQ